MKQNRHYLNELCHCCGWKAWAASAQSFTLWQQATIEITRSLLSSPLVSTINCSLASQALLEVTHQDHSVIACSGHIYSIWAGCLGPESGLPRIENWVPRIRENYHRVPRIRENRVYRIREIGSLQVHTGYLTFSVKKKLYMGDILGAHHVRGESHIQRNVNREMLFFLLLMLLFRSVCHQVSNQADKLDLLAIFYY